MELNITPDKAETLFNEFVNEDNYVDVLEFVNYVAKKRLQIQEYERKEKIQRERIAREEKLGAYNFIAMARKLPSNDTFVEVN